MKNDTILQIANSVATEIRFPKMVNLVGASDRNSMAILDAIKKAAERDVFRAATWSRLTERLTVSVLGDPGGVAYYELPQSWDSIINGTAWDTTNDRAAVGGLNPAQWEELLNDSPSIAADTLYFSFANYQFPLGNWGLALRLYPCEDVSTTYGFICDYRSKWYVIDGSTGEAKGSITSDADTFIFDTEIVTVAAVVRMLRSLGQSYEDEAIELQSMLKDVGAKDGGAVSINMEGRQYSDTLTLPGYAPVSKWRI